MEETGDLSEILFGLKFFLGWILTCQVPIWLLHRVRTARQTKNLTSVVCVTRKRLFIMPNFVLGVVFFCLLMMCSPFILLFDQEFDIRNWIFATFLIELSIGFILRTMMWPMFKKGYKKQYTLFFTDKTLYVYDYFCLSKPRQYELSTIFWKKETEYFRGGSIKTVISFYHENTRIAFLRCKQCINGKEIEKYIKNNISSTPL